MPPKKDIWQRYLHKFSKHGKLLESKSDLGLTEEGDPPASTSKISSLLRPTLHSLRTCD